MWDQYQQEYFTLKAIIFVCIHDAPKGITVSGQTKGKSGCPICMDGTASVYLLSSRKLVFIWHWQFLERKHKYHKMKRHFDNTIEKDSAPKWYTEKTSIWNGKEHSNCIWKGNSKGIEDKENSNLDSHTFQEATNFFKYLPYWKDLETCHIIDLMHVIKNAFDNIIRTLLDMPRKTKDRLKTCNDLL
jgi:hypothetical protein